MRVSSRKPAGSGNKCLSRCFIPDVPITSSDFWQNEDECTEEVLRHVFRSSTEEEIPLFNERMACLREAGKILYEVWPTSFAFLGSPLMDGCRSTNAASRTA